MKKILSIFVFVVLSVSAMCQLLDHRTYRLYAIRTNTNGTLDSFYVKTNTDSLFNKNEVYVQHTKEYYDQFWMPDYPNSFERFVKGGDNIWRNPIFPTDNISGTSGINSETQASIATKANVSHGHAIADVTNLQSSLDGKISSGGNIQTSGGTIGYSAGAGGAITQGGNKGSAVTLNKQSGQITMAGSSLAAGAEVSFTLNNSFISSTDVVFVNIQSVGTVGSYLVAVTAVGNGSCSITISNASSGSLSQALVLNFVVIKGVTN